MSSFTNLDNETMLNERGLEQKCREFAALAHDLIDLELALSTLQRDCAAFRAEYLRIVGTSYAVLDETRARIAESRATLYPDDEAVQAEASRTRQRAETSATRAEDRTSLDQGPSGDPPAALQSLFRAVALKLHPDLAPTEDERAFRRPWMEKLDAAYRKRDVEAVEAIRTEWEASRQPAHAQEVAGDLLRAWVLGELTTGDYADQTRISSEVMQLTRQIGQAKQRINDTQRMLEDLKASDLHKLYREHATRLGSGVNLLDEMAAKLDVQIADAEREDSGARGPGALEPCDAGDLFARGLTDLDRGRRVEGRTRQNRDTEPIAAARPAEEARYEFSVEQWDRLRPALDRVFLAVRRELRPGQNLLREFVKVVRKAFVKGGGSKLAAREACVRWNRETRGGRDVEVADIGPHRPGTMCLEQEPSSRNPTISPWQAACLPSREVDPAGIPWYTLKRSRELLRCLLPRGAAGSLPAQPSFSGDSMSSAWPTLLRGAGIVVIPQPGPSSAHRNRRSLVNRPTAERLGYPSFSYVHALPAHFSTP